MSLLRKLVLQKALHIQDIFNDTNISCMISVLESATYKYYTEYWGHTVAQLVKELRYQLQIHRNNAQWGH